MLNLRAQASAGAIKRAEAVDRRWKAGWIKVKKYVRRQPCAASLFAQDENRRKKTGYGAYWKPAPDTDGHQYPLDTATVAEMDELVKQAKIHSFGVA